MTTETTTGPGPVSYYHEPFTEAERALLRPHFTDLDGPVFAVVNLPEVVKGALFARYSRSPKSVRRLFLDEFVEPTEPGVAAIAAQRAASGEVGIERAEALYRRVFSDYGDDSVAQLGGAHLACEQASNVLTKVLERGRLAAYLEQSTRYIFYDQRLGDHFRYMTPPEVAVSPHAAAYDATMQALFTTYAELVEALVPYYEAMFPRQEGDSAFIWRSTIRAKACDDLRGLLPASTLSNVGIFGSGQSYELLLIRMAAHPSAEVRAYGEMMLIELRRVIPSFLHRVDNPERGGVWSDYFAGIAADLDRRAAELDPVPEPRPEVTLVDWDPDGELRTAAAALYPYSDLPDDQLLDVVKAMGEPERAELIAGAVGDRTNRRHKPGRGLERTRYRFDILCDYGIFRDLQRHRMLTVEWQRLTPAHGYVTPLAIADIGAEDRWRRAMEDAAALHAAVTGDLGPDIAQYVVPLGYRIRFVLDLDAREAFHLIELRSQAGGHPDYRRIAQTMHRLIDEQAGHHRIAAAMTYVDHDDHDLARLDGERRAAAGAPPQGSPTPLDPEPAGVGRLGSDDSPSKGVGDMEPKSFFAGLFDWDFKEFVALKFIKVIYVIGAIVIALGAISFLIAGFSRSVGAGVWALVVGLVGGLLYLIFFRVWLEVIAMLFRIGENTSAMVTALGGQPVSGVMDPGPAIPPSTPPAPGDTPPDPMT